MSSSRVAGMMLIFALLAGCGDNLIPSGEDKRPVVTAGSSGAAVSQKAPDFSVQNTSYVMVTRDSSVAGKKGAVFYFTMWCPICDAHMSDMRASIASSFPDVNFYLVDYVTGSVEGAAASAVSNGYAGGVFSVLADVNHNLVNGFDATMGTTVVIDSGGIVRMNEDYRDGTALYAVLSALP
ncbi:MAG: redoxin domain-containing protein [Desulfuromonadaceae bacterium]|nr:redoxin domain-containing protein [Desulfuromonadaceae bacterium]MDD2856322.1 redoxin domain-containing protein [Desulfuromonadaceae bacterium]